MHYSSAFKKYKYVLKENGPSWGLYSIESGISLTGGQWGQGAVKQSPKLSKMFLSRTFILLGYWGGVLFYLNFLGGRGIFILKNQRI